MESFQVDSVEGDSAEKEKEWHVVEKKKRGGNKTNRERHSAGAAASSSSSAQPPSAATTDGQTQQAQVGERDRGHRERGERAGSAGVVQGMGGRSGPSGGGRGAGGGGSAWGGVGERPRVGSVGSILSGVPPVDGGGRGAPGASAHGHASAPQSKGDKGKQQQAPSAGGGGGSCWDVLPSISPAEAAVLAEADDEEFERLVERQRLEIEAAQSIYSDDLKIIKCGVLSDLETPVEDLKIKNWKSVDHQVELLLTVKPPTNAEVGTARCFLELRIRFGLTYPRTRPFVKLERIEEAPDSAPQKVNDTIEALLAERIGDEVIYELCSALSDLLDAWNIPEGRALYEEMEDRHAREAEERWQREEAERQKKKEEDAKRRPQQEAEARRVRDGYARVLREQRLREERDRTGGWSGSDDDDEEDSRGAMASMYRPSTNAAAGTRGGHGIGAGATVGPAGSKLRGQPASPASSRPHSPPHSPRVVSKDFQSSSRRAGGGRELSASTGRTGRGGGRTRETIAGPPRGGLSPHPEEEEEGESMEEGAGGSFDFELDGGVDEHSPPLMSSSEGSSCTSSSLSGRQQRRRSRRTGTRSHSPPPTRSKKSPDSPPSPSPPASAGRSSRSKKEKRKDKERERGKGSASDGSSSLSAGAAHRRGGRGGKERKAERERERGFGEVTDEDFVQSDPTAQKRPRRGQRSGRLNGDSGDGEALGREDGRGPGRQGRELRSRSIPRGGEGGLGLGGQGGRGRGKGRYEREDSDFQGARGVRGRTRGEKVRTDEEEEADVETAENEKDVERALNGSRYFSDFKFIKELGRGAFGVVVKVKHKVDKRFYAIKRVELVDDAETNKRILQEAAMLPRLQHPHIVRYYQAWIESDVLGLFGSVRPQSGGGAPGGRFRTQVAGAATGVPLGQKGKGGPSLNVRGAVSSLHAGGGGRPGVGSRGARGSEAAVGRTGGAALPAHTLPQSMEMEGTSYAGDWLSSESFAPALMVGGVGGSLLMGGSGLPVHLETDSLGMSRGRNLKGGKRKGGGMRAEGADLSGSRDRGGKRGGVAARLRAQSDDPLPFRGLRADASDPPEGGRERGRQRRKGKGGEGKKKGNENSDEGDEEERRSSSLSRSFSFDRDGAGGGTSRRRSVHLSDGDAEGSLCLFFSDDEEHDEEDWREFFENATGDEWSPGGRHGRKRRSLSRQHKDSRDLSGVGMERSLSFSSRESDSPPPSLASSSEADDLVEFQRDEEEEEEEAAQKKDRDKEREAGRQQKGRERDSIQQPPGGVPTRTKAARGDRERDRPPAFPRGTNLNGLGPASGALDRESRGDPPPPRQFLFIQMEFCEGHTLREAIDDETREILSENDAKWRCFRQILEALLHIHMKKTIHRDLKPSNIFLEKSQFSPSAYDVKCGDFGLATLLRQTRRPSTRPEGELEAEGNGKKGEADVETRQYLKQGEQGEEGAGGKRGRGGKLRGEKDKEKGQNQKNALGGGGGVGASANLSA
eukprot:Cvel_17975.t1-p1 / transcript=Cvel_17975.t1 / gene=Cvel_17975 / organism=Chromera_velia_CCMP2878 / gene_product=Serine/threonine-protein kinase GCN2, putative / transcript_product=Serine/threonine-protein kinase GCN2, putative / location=Cvel_scaffold1463:33745-45414(+) / protein_length=1487 / sequence_SO=supercontig / SO=protein_coding / is_pseudo=false